MPVGVWLARKSGKTDGGKPGRRHSTSQDTDDTKALPDGSIATITKRKDHNMLWELKVDRKALLWLRVDVEGSQSIMRRILAQLASGDAKADRADLRVLRDSMLPPKANAGGQGSSKQRRVNFKSTEERRGAASSAGEQQAAQGRVQPPSRSQLPMHLDRPLSRH